MRELSEPRRVLMTADAVGGVFTYALRLGTLLVQRGIEAHVATMGPLPKDAQRRGAKEAGIVLHESEFRLEWMPAPWEDVDEAAGWLLDLERAIAPDIVQLNGYCHGALPFRAPVVVVAHSCVLSWWRAVHKEPAPSDWDEYRHRVVRGIHAAELVIAPTRAMLASIESEYGRPRSSLVIHHAGDGEAFEPAGKSSFVLSAGRLWDKAKNIASLEAIAGRAPYPILVAGSHRLSESGPKAQLGNLQLLGELEPEDLAWWMARAAVYALPARYEPFGLSVLEAALSGCALVLGDIESLRELWEGAALFVDPDDVDALEAAILSLMVNHDRRGALARSARARAMELRPDEMASAYLDAYRGLLKVRATRASGPRPNLAGDPCA